MSYSGYGRWLHDNVSVEAADEYEVLQEQLERTDTSFKAIADQRDWLTVDAVVDSFRLGQEAIFDNV